VRYALRATAGDAGHIRGHFAFYSELTDMVDAGIGRLLIASLHQGIADVSPSRLEFYENWLSPTGLREGRMGMAPLGAVLSFLYREEAPADVTIPAAAGARAAQWTHTDASAFRQRIATRLPLGLRTRAALGMAKGLVGETLSVSSVRTRFRRGQGTVEIDSPLFEYLRDPSPVPIRRYYAAAYAEVLRLSGLDASVTIADAPGCRLVVEVRGARPRSTTLLEQ
jgi:hypothetical protein